MQLPADQNPKDIKLEVPFVPTKTHPIEVSVDGKRLGPINALVLRAGPDNTVTNVSVEMPIATTLEFCGYILPTVSVPEDEEIERLLASVYNETVADFPLGNEVSSAPFVDQHLKAEFVRELIQNFCAKF